jgi:hypothetical protein
MNRYIIVSSGIALASAGYKWEVLDTETHRTICAMHSRELAELIIPLLPEMSVGDVTQ